VTDQTTPAGPGPAPAHPPAAHPTADVPARLFDDPAAEARWRARFAAPRVSLPDWARLAPDRSTYLSNASGTYEVYAWNRATGEHRQVTHRPHGTHLSEISPDGRRIWWFDDTDGDEFGHWVTEPFDGPADGAATPTTGLAGADAGYPAGLELGESVTTLAASTDDGTTVWAGTDDGPARVLYRHADDAGVGALSRDDELVALAHSEHGDSRHTAVRVLRTTDGSTVADLWDGPGLGLAPLAFSPVRGDSRLLISHERHGREALLIWDPRTGTQTELDTGLPGELTGDWYPDGSAILIAHTRHARTTLHRFDPAAGELTELPTAAGTVRGAAVRPDGSVEYAWSSSSVPPVVRALAADGTDEILLRPGGEAAPEGPEVTDAWVDGPGGPVHALIATPPRSAGPLPAVFYLHGGPQAADEDRYSPVRAAWVDAGFAVVHVNYRGSTGYGSAWRDAIEGRPGLTELEDVAAVHDWAVASGLADPARCAVVGYSWGGYLTLLALGAQPGRWAAGVAGVPVADYLAAYQDEMEPLRAFDRALFGGSPQEVGERYRACSPISYVDQVRAPVLVLAGANDPRCPIRQIENYLDELARRAAPYAVYRYDAGHGSLVVAETLRQVAAEIGFIRSRLPAG
jgi:dipeptidyl aminopeptidase/acylaminoacyl peptidase